MKTKFNLSKSVAMRALRAFVAGFVATAVSLPILGITTWSDLYTSLSAIALAGTVGGIGAMLMALDKYFRS
jgi:branched-subunit amino acid permease